MMRSIIFYLFIGALVLGGCKSSEKTKETKVRESAILNKEFTTESGLKYTITHEGSGARAKAGDMVSVHYTGRLTNDTIFDSSVPRGEPFSFKLGAGQVIKGWDEGIALLNVGDKAILTIPSNLGYGERAMGGIPANSTLIFEVELMGIKESPKPWPLEKVKTEKTESGLTIHKYNETDGAKPSAGQTVKVHYSGYLEDGSMFDSSVERGQPIAFSLGVGQVIKGWDEGISLLRVGEKAKLVIPYDLAYGAAGRPPIIPPSATLIFDVELIGIQ